MVKEEPDLVKGFFSSMHVVLLIFRSLESKGKISYWPSGMDTSEQMIVNSENRFNL